MIATWWAGLSLIMKILWGVTLTASLIFIIQSVLTFVGADVDGATDFDVDVDSSMDGADLSNIEGGSNLYTFRNFVNFILGFGWSAILLQESISSIPVLIIVSVLIGIALVAIVMYLFKLPSGMQQRGNINLQRSAAGCEGKHVGKDLDYDCGREDRDNRGDRLYDSGEGSVEEGLSFIHAFCLEGH